MSAVGLCDRDIAVCDAIDEAEDADLRDMLREQLKSDYAVASNAGLDDEKALKVAQMRDIQRAYLEMLEVMEYPVDQNGRVHDLNAMSAATLGIAWTAVLYGFRRSAEPLIKKRRIVAAGVYDNACTWVDVRAPDLAERDLRPGDYSSDRLLPPDVRGMAAAREGEGPTVTAEWHTKPKVRYVDEPRPED
ncbi:hypothetical protein [Mycolicibacterium fortuitum]|uniref:phage gene 29 protein family protein n=1 Tax=Mycolicibacterium fortuitum TaxID=1766 RepID=UPI000B315C7E|nr:hypothetical protein [Mycolicibacterium fortuitum]